jgi:hypothetical protein
MIKLQDLLELERPNKIYADKDPNKEITIADLTPEEKEELFKKGSLLVKVPSDPNRPETTVSQVINLPKIDKIKKEVIQNKREFDVFMFSANPDIKNTAKEINKLYNNLFKAMNALDKLLELQKQGRI